MFMHLRKDSHTRRKRNSILQERRRKRRRRMKKKERERDRGREEEQSGEREKEIEGEIGGNIIFFKVIFWIKNKSHESS